MRVLGVSNTVPYARSGTRLTVFLYSTVSSLFSDLDRFVRFTDIRQSRDFIYSTVYNEFIC